MTSSLVSVIVTTKNSARTLQQCLASVQKQNYENIELIVVDNKSTDETIEIANKYTNHVYSKGPERSAQRNFGVEKSRGEYLLFLDSDMMLSDTVISECVDLMKDDVAGLYIPERIVGEGFWIKVRNFERSFYNETVIDAVRFVKRSDFDAVGGFDESLFAGEDWDFDKRMRKRGKTDSTNSPLFHDETLFNIVDYITKKAYYVPNLEEYKQKWPNDKVVQKQFNFYYRYIGVFVENGKWKKIVRQPFLFLGVLFLKGFIGIAYIIK